VRLPDGTTAALDLKTKLATPRSASGYKATVRGTVVGKARGATKQVTCVSGCTVDALGRLSGPKVPAHARPLSIPSLLPFRGASLAQTPGQTLPRRPYRVHARCFFGRCFVFFFLNECLTCLRAAFVAQVKFEVKGGDRDGTVYEGEMQSGDVAGKGVAYHNNGAKRCAAKVYF
jgi:hypothetical protein